MNLPKEKTTYNNYSIDFINFQTHLSRIESSIGLNENRFYPRPIQSVQIIFQWIINNIKRKVTESFDSITNAKKHGQHIDLDDIEGLKREIESITKIIINFYNRYWGSVDFAVHSVPWYFDLLVTNILNKVLKGAGNFKLIIFPDSEYNLEIASLETEIKKNFGLSALQLDEINKELKEDKISGFFIFRLPPQLVLDPMANFLIFHEIGHYFANSLINPKIIEKTIPKIKPFFEKIYLEPLESKTTKAFILSDKSWAENWLREIICDCFSTAFGGPASLAAAREYFLLETDVPKRTHPSPSLRIRSIQCFINHYLNRYKIKETKTKRYFGNLFAFAADPLMDILSELFNHIGNTTNTRGLFYFKAIFDNFDSGVEALKNDILPIDILGENKDWLFDYILTFNCIWSLFLKKRENFSGWRDKYNEILLKLLEIEQFRNIWIQNIGPRKGT